MFWQSVEFSILNNAEIAMGGHVNLHRVQYVLVSNTSSPSFNSTTILSYLF